MRSRGRAVATIVLAIMFACSAASCSQARDAAEAKFEPNVAGTLTVATNLPAPGFWSGEDAADVDGGFEWGIATELADRFDLDLVVVDAEFADITAGQLHGADLALSQVSITDAREQHVDFSSAYFGSSPTVVAPTGKELTDLATAREWSWAVEAGTTEADFVADVIDPDEEMLVVADEEAAVDAVRAGKVDGALVDLPTALVLTKDDGNVEAIPRFDRTEDYGAVLPKGSANTEVVDQQLAAMDADGTLGDLDDQWLQPAFARDPSDLPVIQTS